jgi:prepilin-type N-terminal cleavage/methylation domain-containing protein
LGSRGFTVIELVSVMALLGLLSTMGLVIGRNVAQAAKASSTVTQMAYLQKALVNMATHCEGLPVYSSTGDPGLVTKSTRNKTCWQGPYIPRWPATTSFGVGSFLYQGAAGSPATVRVQGLTSAQASSVAAEVAAIYGGKATVTSGSGGVLSVSVAMSAYYQR